MKKRIISLISVLCLIMGVFSVAVPANAASAIFGSHEVNYGPYGVIYFTLAPKDFTSDLDYINSQAVYSNSDANSFLPMEILNNDNIQSINIVLTHDWETKYFITNKKANVNIDLNGHTWKITGSSGLRTEKKNITISGGTMMFTDTTWGPITTYGGNIDVQNVVFKNVRTSGYGVIYVDDKSGNAGSVNLENVTFENCYSDSYGGCVYINSDKSKSTINNCRFINCTATNSGGAVYVDGNNCDVSFNSCRFTGCKSENNGGAFSIAGNYCDISFYSCSAFNCHADDCGGFMYVWGKHDKINGFGDKSSSKYEDRSIVVNCHALGHGGAVYFSDDTASGHYGDIRNFIFASNAAGATSRTNIVGEKKGGAVCVYSESVDVCYCDFYDNYAGDVGGAIYLQDNYDDVEYCTFENNDCGEGEGYDIYIDDADTWVWYNTVYTSQSSAYAIYNNSGGSVRDNTFNPSASFGGGDGSASNPYIISNAEHMRLLARNVNAGTNYGNKYFVQTADIKNVCAPIGNNYYASHYFGGHFDGQGHSVTIAMYKNGCAASLFAHLSGAEVHNVCVKGYTGGTMAAGVAGHAHCSIITGCTNEATVESTSDWYAGGVVAYSVNYTYISQCKNTGKVSGNSRVGGIAGYVYNGAVVESYNAGAVSASTYTGGIVGHTEGTLFVTNCTNDAPISSALATGGIVGYSKGETTVINCYNTKRGVIAATNAYSGGMLGYCDNNVSKTVWGTKQCMTKRIYNCVNYGEIKCKNTGAGGIVGHAVSNVPSGTSGTPLEIYNCASYCSTPEIYVSGQITGTECHGTFTKCYISQKYQHWWETYAALSDKQFGQYLVDKLNAEVKSKNSGTVPSGSDWYTEPRPGDWAEWTVGAGLGMAVPLSSEKFLHTEPRQEMGGKGTKNEPYTILSNTQLKTLQSDVEAGKDFTGCYFELTGHIRYTGKPIGTETHPFTGTFNGAGYTVIIDMNLPDSDYCGLFGYAKNCTVKNLTVSGIVKCNNYAAGIVAHAGGNVTIDNCCSDLADIVAKNICAAGICAVSEGTTVIKNCRNSSSVQSQSKEKYNPINIDDDIGIDIDAPVLRSPYGRSDPEREKRLKEQAEKKRREVLQKLNEERMQTTYNQCAGGIIGRATSGDVTVLNTVNVGSVSAFSRVGGMIGKSEADALKIYNCGNYGTVSVGSDMAALGGLVGQAESVDMLVCLNAYIIPEPDEIPKDAHYGALVGLVNEIDQFGTCYYLIKVTGYGIPGYNAGSDRIDTDKFTATSIKKALLKPTKFNNTKYEEAETYGFTTWIKSTEDDETNGLPVPGNFEQIDITTKKSGGTYSAAAGAIAGTSFFASVYASSDILIIGILFAISAAAVTAVIIYKKN